MIPSVILVYSLPSNLMAPLNVANQILPARSWMILRVMALGASAYIQESTFPDGEVGGTGSVDSWVLVSETWQDNTGKHRAKSTKKQLGLSIDSRRLMNDQMLKVGEILTRFGLPLRFGGSISRTFTNIYILNAKTAHRSYPGPK